MTEKEYIEREAAYKACEAYFNGVCVYDVSASEVINDFEEVIDAVPTADVAPIRHGRWIINSDGYYPQCSECMSEPRGREMTKYCSDCGALMDGDKYD